MLSNSTIQGKIGISESFVFPISVTPDSHFDSYDDLLRKIEEEFELNRVPYNKIDKLFTVRYQPMRFKCKSVLINCRFCRAFLLA